MYCNFEKVTGNNPSKKDGVVMREKKSGLSRVQRLKKRLSHSFGRLTISKEEVEDNSFHRNGKLPYGINGYSEEFLDRLEPNGNIPQEKFGWDGLDGHQQVHRQLSVSSDSKLLDEDIREETRVILRPKKPPRPKSEVFLNKDQQTRRTKRFSAFGGDSPFGKSEAYVKLEPLGEGSYATVYKGYSHLTNQLVALKQIRLQEEEGAPFTAIREASLLKELKHANIVTLHDIVHTKFTLTFVFEYVHTDLSQYMERHVGGLVHHNVQLFLFQLLRGLCYCHRRLVLHRDVKPQNLLISEIGELKLADFGLARAKSVPSHTYSHEVVTLWYRPPDVLLGSTEYSTSLDMWGVGCIFLEMITGVPTFPGVRDTYDQLNKIFKVLGMPSEDMWPGVSHLPGYAAYKQQAEKQYLPKLPLGIMFPRIYDTTEAANLATSLLQLNPDKRIGAEEALRHKYFSSLPKKLYELPDESSIFTVEGVQLWPENVLNRKISENLAVAGGVTAAVERNMPVEDRPPFERLPKNVVPSHYDLFLKPDLKDLVFDGRVIVTVEVKEPTQKVTLNALDLNIKKATVRNIGDAEITAEKIALSTELETVTLIFPETIQTGATSLTLEFVGELNDKMKGLYRSKYTSPTGEERYAAVTQFEATDARRCFPCWDEPAIKATFDITLVVPKDRVALSNMPVASEEDAPDGLRILHFQRTPVMSTYLVAVVVGEFDFIEDRSQDGVLVRVYTPVGKTEQGKFALHCATKVLPYYKDYFQIAYPLPKMDLIAIADFACGAMENWGLVTYRETCLLVDPENTSAVRKQWIALVVAHELAHQWFGNLVTMEWWTHLWLNEGYASFVEFLFVDNEFPEYDIWTQFVTDTYCSALELDSLDSSHPIEVPVGHPSEIDEIFDDISYSKGASIIRMLHNHIGDDDFRKGMHLYLTRHQYGNTATEDLWAALGEASKKPVAAIMSTWTKQKGFPVVRVQVVQKDEGKVRLKLQQQRFCANGKKGNDSSRWLIPISIRTSAGPSTIVSTILEDESMETDVPLPKDGWLIVNPGTVGFYRTAYPSELLERFLPAVKDKSLPPLDRLGLLDNVFALVQAGEMPTVEVLKLMQAFTAEDNFTVWSTIANCLGKLNILLSHTEFEEDLKRYTRNLLKQIYQRVGWDAKENESHLDRLLRSLIIGRLVDCNEESAIAEAKRRFADHFEGKTTIPADLRSAVYRAVMSDGDASAYDSLLKLYREAELREERDRISRSLGAAKDESTLSKVLEFALSEEVRSQDSIFVIISVAAHSAIGRNLAWEFFKNNWKTTLERYDSGFLLSRLVKFITENFATEAKAQEIEKFFQTHKFPATERTVQQSIETIRLNEAWLKRDLPSVRQFLTQV